MTALSIGEILSNHDLFRRKMTVSYKAEACLVNAVPMLRIANRFLRDIAKINVGDKVEVEYAENSVTIRKTNLNHD